MRQEAYRMQQAGTRQGAHRRAPARHLPAGRLALCRSLHTAITRFLGRFSWSCSYKAQAAIEQKLEPTLFGSTLDKSRQSVQCYRCRAVPKLTLFETAKFVSFTHYLCKSETFFYETAF